MPLENQTTTKERAQRIRLDYLRRRSALERWKLGLVLLAIIVAIAYVAWASTGRDPATNYSPGPLATVHAMWDNRCDKCHESFVPTGATAWAADPHAADKLCETCHRTAVHATNQIDMEVTGCAACHRDHQGRSADLLRVANSTCTACHADIAKHIKPGADPTKLGLKNVTSFVTDHPDFKFRSPRQDPGPLKFSHAWHLLPGLPFGKGPYQLSDLSAADRDRYRRPGQNDHDLITLDCQSCHQLQRPSQRVQGAANGAEVGQASATGPVRAAGDYMLPINYELHCRACHPLAYSGSTQPAVAGATAGETSRLAARPGETVPHGWSDTQLRRYLEQALTAQVVNNPDASVLGTPLRTAVKNQPPPSSPLPNKRPAEQTEAHTIGDYVKAELNDRLATLRNECLVCHDAVNPGRLEVKPVSVSHPWLEQAKFDHTAHRMVDCESCHAFDFPKKLPENPQVILAAESAEKIIPKREVCLECHSPPLGSGANAQGGARFDCIECHRYHDGPMPSLDVQLRVNQ